MPGTRHRNALQPGFRIKWYEIRQILGQGGFGITYLALDTNLDQEVAVKEYLPIELAVREGDHTVHPASADNGEQFQWGKDRFISEAKTLAKFKHPNIVRVYSVFEALNTAYMIMEYERGHSLQEKLAGRRTLDEAELRQIALPVMDGLRLVHQAGFIHRDIKPANIFVREDGSPVLLDFGSARQAVGGHTKTLTSLVSPGYAPFEQYHSKSDEQGPWTDIYGLGATLYRAATGVPPMDALDRSRSLLQESADTFVTTEQIAKGRYSDRFLRAVDHALQFRADDRPRSVGEWMGEIGADEAVTRLNPDAPLTQPTRLSPRSRSRQSRNSKLLYVVAAGLLLLAGGGYVVFRLTIAPPATAVPEPVLPLSAPTAGAPPAVPAPEPAPAADNAGGSASRTPVPAATQTTPPMPAGEESRTAQAAGTVPVQPTHSPRDLERQARQKRIATMLAAGQSQIVAGQWTEPARSNALATYRTVLEEDPGNTEARAGMDQIFEHYLGRAETAARTHDVHAARTALSLADSVKPGSPEVSAVRDQMKADEDRMRREAEAARERRAREQSAREEAQRRAAEQARKEAALAKAQAKLEECRRKQHAPITEPKRAGKGAGLYFAAIAVGDNDGWGEAQGYQSRKDAEDAALEGCRERDKGCKVQIWTNDCLAFATGEKGAAGWSWGSSLHEAREKAIGFCEAHAACCNVQASYCADDLGPTPSQ